MLFINLGLSKTSTTNLQKNFYPNLKGIYFWKNYTNQTYNTNLNDSKLLNKFIKYINHREEEKIDKIYIDNLKSEIKLFIESKSQNVLISNDTFMLPFSRLPNTSNEHIIVSQWIKLQRLKNFFEDLQIKTKYFIIYRNPLEGIPSLFGTFGHRLINLFGDEYRVFNKILLDILDSRIDTSEMELFFDQYNIEKIRDILETKSFRIFHLDKISKNPEEFNKEISSYLNVFEDKSLIEKLKIKTRVTTRIMGKRVLKTNNELYFFLKTKFPRLVNIIDDPRLKKLLMLIFKKNKTIEVDYSLLKKVLSKLKINY